MWGGFLLQVINFTLKTICVPLKCQGLHSPLFGLYISAEPGTQQCQVSGRWGKLSWWQVLLKQALSDSFLYTPLFLTVLVSYCEWHSSLKQQPLCVALVIFVG